MRPLIAGVDATGVFSLIKEGRGGVTQRRALDTRNRAVAVNTSRHVVFHIIFKTNDQLVRVLGLPWVGLGTFFICDRTLIP